MFFAYCCDSALAESTGGRKAACTAFQAGQSFRLGSQNPFAEAGIANHFDALDLRLLDRHRRRRLQQVGFAVAVNAESGDDGTGASVMRRPLRRYRPQATAA